MATETPKTEPKYPADLPVANRLQLELLERIAVACERIAAAAETTATPPVTEIENVAAPGITSATVQPSRSEHKHGRGGSRA